MSDDCEVPDVTGPVEYADAGNDFLRHVLAVRGRAPDRLILFPYPNTPPKLRQIAVPTFPDLLKLWVSAGRIGRITDPQLSGRVSMDAGSTTSRWWAQPGGRAAQPATSSR